MSLSWTLPLPIALAPGATEGLSDILNQSFGSVPSDISGAWLYDYSATDLAESNFSYWTPSSPSVGTWFINGAPISPDTSIYVSRATFGSTVFQAGNNIGDLADVYVGSTWYSMITVAPALINLPTGNQEPTAADIVAEAYRFNSYYGFVPNNNDCHFIDMAVAAGVGATLPSGPSDSLNPASNQDGGFWRVVYRGSDPNPVSHWQTLVQPGDIVRMGWTLTGGPHTTLVLAVNPDSSIVVYDNGYYVNGVEGIGIHTVNYDKLTIASDTTIYRLTNDGSYLQTGDDNGELIPGSIFNDKLIGGTGNDQLFGGLGNDVFSPGGGADTIDGGAGSDKVQVIANSTGAAITHNADGSITVGYANGSLSLTNVELLSFADQTIHLHDSAANDFTANNISDVLFRNSSNGDIGFYQLNSAGNFQDWRDIGLSSLAYDVVGTGDFNSSGQSEILFRNDTTGAVGFYQTDHQGNLLGWHYIASSSPAYTVHGVGDFNGDQISDILFRNATTGDTGFYQLNRDGTFSNWHGIGSSSTAYTLEGVGNFNSDGNSDLFFHNKTTGDAGFYTLTNDGSFKNWQDIGNLPSAYSVVGIADFNSDGISDILLRNSSTGDIGFEQINPNGTLQGWHDIGSSSTAYGVAGVGIYTSSGFEDILFRNLTTGDLGFYQLDHNGVFQTWHSVASSSATYTIMA